MNAGELIGELETLGVRLWEESGQLRFRAPQGVLTEERRTALRASKAEVLAFLRRDERPETVRADPAGRHEPFPLTNVQTAYLLGRRDVFEYGGVSCQVYGELAFPELDVVRLGDAWRMVVARHDMLRAVIHPDGYQQVLPEVPDYRIAAEDLRGADPATAQTALRRTREELSHRAYVPEEWPLFDLRATLTDERALLHVSIDFLIADYLSIQHVLSELIALYRDPATPLPPLDITFRDYLLAERRLQQGSRHERDREYWWGRADELPAAPELPVQEQAAEIAPARFRRLSTALPPDRWAELRRRAADHEVTPSGAVLAAFADVVGRWSRRPRFTLNLTLLNRQPLHPQVDHLVGDFTTVTLLAVDLAAGQRFRDRAIALQRQLWQDMDHRRCSGVEVMRELARRRGRGAALMPVVFTSTIGLGAEDQATEQAGEEHGRLVYGISQTPQVWIDCQAVERGGGLVLNWDVREGVFPPGLVEDMFDALSAVLVGMGAGDEAWQRTGPLPLPAPQRERRRRVNDTAGPMPDALLHEGVLAQALRTPDRLAVVSDRRSLTYRDLLGRAAAVATELAEAGAGPGDIVAVAMDKGWEQVVAVLGTLLAGAAYVPVDTSQPPARRDRILADAGARHALTQSWLAAGAWPSGLRCTAVDTLPPHAAPGALPHGRVDPDGLAYVIYTSGSTGKPKGVMISHRAAGNTIDDINRRLRIGPEDRVLGLANLGFDLSVYDLFGPLATGGCVVLPDAGRRGDPSHWAELVSRHGVTVWNSVPAQLQMLQHYLESEPAVPLPSLRLAMLSGDWIPVALPDQVRARIPGLTVISLGGATEAAIWSIWFPVTEVPPDWRSIPYGTPLTNQTWHVLDEAMQPCPDWVAGELYIGGAGLALGYLGDEARTAERFLRHPVSGERLYRTGDFGRYLPDGTIEFLGRQDSQVKIRGHRIELAEVEHALGSHPAVRATSVLVDGDRPMERRLVAFAQPARRPATTPDPVAAERLTTAARDTAGLVPAAQARQFVEFVRRLDEVALVTMLEVLQEGGLFATASDAHTAEEVLAGAAVAPAHHRLVGRWLGVLAGAGKLTRRTDGRYQATGPVDAPTVAQAWRELEDLRAGAGLSDELPRYLRSSTGQLGALLRGEQDALTLLFPEGRTGTVEAAYHDYLIGDHVNRLVIGMVREAGQQRPATGPLRVLEIGAGVGGTSSRLIPALADREVDYLFTDVSQFFLNEARERFEAYPWVRYGLFDLNGDYRAQGLLPHSADVIVAGNVMHYARHAGQALSRLSELLAPGGWLVFLEATRDNPWVMASMELIEGEGTFEDFRRDTDETFLERDQWLALLAEAGAGAALCLPSAGDELSRIGQHVFAARFKADMAPVEPAELSRHAGERLPEYMIPQHIQVVDRIPLTGNGKIDRATLKSWLPGERSASGAAPGTEPRDDLERRIAGLWSNLLQVPGVGRDQDFFELGGDSLLVSQLAGRLREQLPEAAGRYFDTLLRQILQHPTVAALADFLRQPEQQAPAPTARPKASPLVPLGGSGDAAVRVLVHDAGGTMASYVGLARELARSGPVVGLAVTKVADYLELDAEGLVDRLADDYARLLLDEGREPLHVIGYDTAGLLALEVARRLTEAGVDVDGLTLIGSQPVPGDIADELLIEYAFARSKGVVPAAAGFPFDHQAVARAVAAVLAGTPGRIPAGRLATLTGDPGLEEVATGFRELARQDREDRLAAIGEALTASREDIDAQGFVSAHFEVFRHSIRALGRHEAQLYAGDITLLRPTEGLGPAPWATGDPVAYWRELALGEVTSQEVPGTHAGCLRPPHVAQLAQLLAAGTDGTDVGDWPAVAEVTS